MPDVKRTNGAKSTKLVYIKVVIVFAIALVIGEIYNLVSDNTQQFSIENAALLSNHNQWLYELTQNRTTEEFRKNGGLSHWRPGTHNLQHPHNLYIWDYFPENFACPTLENVGSIGEQSKWLCGVDAFLQEPGCIVYSVGVTQDFTFELGILRRTQCDIYIFDPAVSLDTAESIKKHLGARGRLFLIGVGDRESDETIEVDGQQISAKLKSLPTIMAQLKHTWVDVVKLDIQGHEYRALWPLVQSGKLPFTQIVMEVNDIMGRMEVPKVFKLLSGLVTNGGYRTFHRAPNMWKPQASWQYSLIKVNKRGRVIYSKALEEKRRIVSEFKDMKSTKPT